MLDIKTGYTEEDGLVFLRLVGDSGDQKNPCPNCGKELGRQTHTVIMEPDMAEKVAKRMLASAKSAWERNKRTLIVGQPQTFKRG
jgi:transposase-like protein